MDQLKLELGCGTRPTPGYIHHDRIKYADYVDLAWDLRQFPWRVRHCNRHGVVVDCVCTVYDDWQKHISDHAFLDEILALDVFEHVDPHLETCLNESWRLLKPDGLLDIRLPSAENPLTYRDPQHVRGYHQETLDYWDPDKQPHEWGHIYYHEANRWWRVVEVFEENNDWRYRLRKRG